MNKQEEQEKYIRSYSMPGYKMGSRRKLEALQAVKDWPPGYLLDVGCGRGEFITQMEVNGFECRGTEVVPDLLNDRVTFAWCDELPFKDNTFEYATCWDVLEHLVPGEEAHCLMELQRVASKGIAFSANNQRSRNHLGEELHINIKSYNEWEALVFDLFPDKYIISHPHPEMYSPIWLVQL